MRLNRLDPADADWERMDAFPDRVVFEMRPWIEFIQSSQEAEPVVAAVEDNGCPRGYFTGLLVRRYGFSILGSPMPGWTSAFMGFNLEPGVSRRAAAEALIPFAFDSLGCSHLELHDYHLTLSQVGGLGFEHTTWTGLQVDLTPPEDEIFAAMQGRCRTAIRKASREGVVIEEGDGIDFAEDFYPQLVDVFAKQGLVPPYGVGRVRDLIRCVYPSGRLLLLRARGPDGECIATGIFPASNRVMHFLAGASWRHHQRLNPNEPLVWHAMRYWKARGVETCDLGYLLDYKRKFGGRELEIPFFRRSRSSAVATMRNLAEQAFLTRQRLRGRWRAGVHRLSRRHRRS
jgi:Acetyltransferase (GNAT) domain